MNQANRQRTYGPTVHQQPHNQNKLIDYLVKREKLVINRTFAEFKVNAQTDRGQKGALVSSTSYISYKIQRGNGQKVNDIEKIMRELGENISALRGKPTPIMLEFNPLSIQVPHPSPIPLRWDTPSVGNLPPHSMLLGKSFSHSGGSRMETIAFDDSPHILVAGTTGAGKSVLMQSMISSLCANTSPQELQIVMVDLKNEDMIPFANWPHIISFSGDINSAIDAIASIVEEKNRRIECPGEKHARLVLWIDELLQLAQEREAVAAIGDLASIGRSKSINIVVATQHPTEQGGMGSVMKANFSTRLVGQVAPGQSYAATQRRKLYADMLPGKGSFLRIEGADARRFQSYLITQGDIDRVGKSFKSDWLSTGYRTDMTNYDSQLQPAIASYSQSPTRESIAPSPIASYDSQSVNFPIGVGRPLTDIEASAVNDLVASGHFDYRGEMSINRAMMYIYGSRSPERSEWIREAIQEFSQ